MVWNYIFELAVYALLPYFIYLIFKEDKIHKIKGLFFTIFLYSFFIEFLTSHITHLYDYKVYLLSIDNIPLYIPLAWTYLYYFGYRIYNSNLEFFNKKGTLFTAGFLSLFVLTYDLVIDVFAVRMNLWTWNGINLTEQWYGIYYFNYLWWFLSVFYFLYIWLSNKNISRVKLFIYSLSLHSITIVFPIYLFPILVKHSFFFSDIVKAIFITVIFTRKTWVYKVLTGFNYKSYEWGFLISTLMINLLLLGATFIIVEESIPLIFSIYSMILYGVFFTKVFKDKYLGVVKD